MTTYRIEEYLIQDGKRFQVQCSVDGKEFQPVVNEMNLTTYTFKNREAAESVMDAMTGKR